VIRFWHFGHSRMSGLADGKQVDPAASCPEVDPSIRASDRMFDMEKCQTVKAGVLSRWKSHVLRDMARGGKGTAARQIDGEARPVLSAREVWEASSLVRAKEIRTGTQMGKGWSQVPPCQ
jgi:hypothetical protein